jgi:hypothetical protein
LGGKKLAAQSHIVKKVFVTDYSQPEKIFYLVAKRMPEIRNRSHDLK